jgi:hypothetical protein
VSTALSNGDEKYKLKFRFTEQDGNIEEYSYFIMNFLTSV